MWNNDLNKQRHCVCYWSVVDSELDIFCSSLLMPLEDNMMIMGTS